GAVPERWAGTRALSRYRGPAKATGHPTRRLPPWARTARAKYPNNCPSSAARIEACTPAHEECLEQTGRGAPRRAKALRTAGIGWPSEARPKGERRMVGASGFEPLTPAV